jgi:hypothetical protein
MFSPRLAILSDAVSLHKDSSYRDIDPLPAAQGLRMKNALMCCRRLTEDVVLALAWLRYRPVPIISIIGARKLSQFQDNLASFELTLSTDQLKTLDEASVIELGLYAKAMPRAICYGGLRDQIDGYPGN